MSAPEPDPPEVEELERCAAWRLRLVDANPSDTKSVIAAALLEKLAEELRRTIGSAPARELAAVCNWLSESDAISDFAELAGEYRSRIGISEMPADAQDYLRGLLAIARTLT